MNQAFSKIWIVVILAIFIAGGILTWQYLMAPKEEVVEDETADWNIYQHKEYGFEMKFPKDWRIVKAIIADPEATGPVESVFGLHPKDKVYYHTVGGYTKGTIDPISIEIWRSMEDYQKMWGGVAGAKKVLISDNISALYWGNEIGEIFYIFENPNNNIVVTLRSEIDMISYQLEPSEIEELKHIFNQMLSTFKFIEK